MTRILPSLWSACPTTLLLIGALALAFGASIASAAPSSSDGLPAVRIAETSPDPGDVERAKWQKRAVDAYRDLAEARQRHDAAVAHYSRLRSHNRDRGDARVNAVHERAEAEANLAAAETRLESLSEEARKAGVPPGWIRVFDEDWAGDSEPANTP